MVLTMAKDSKRDPMTPARRAEVVAYLRDILNGCESGWGRVQTEPQEWPAAIRDAVSVLAVAGMCGFCGREVYADLKPMCGDCAGKEDPSTATLRADLAKAKEEIDLLAEERDSEADEHRCAEVECSELRAQLAKAKERDEWHTERLRGLALAGENLAKATPDRVLRMELERFVRLAKEAPP